MENENNKFVKTLCGGGIGLLVGTVLFIIINSVTGGIWSECPSFIVLVSPFIVPTIVGLFSTGFNNTYGKCILHCCVAAIAFVIIGFVLGLALCMFWAGWELFVIVIIVAGLLSSGGSIILIIID